VEAPRLFKLSTADLRVLGDVQLDVNASAKALALDEVGGQLFVLTLDGLEVRAASDLSLLHSEGGARSPSPRLAFDRRARRLYLTQDQALRAYDASLTFLWHQDTGAAIADLMLTPDGRTLQMRIENSRATAGAVDTLLALDAATGQIRYGPLKVWDGYWYLGAADDAHAYVLGNDEQGALVALADAQGRIVARYSMGGFQRSALYDPGARRLYLPDSRHHLLQVLDAQDLTPLGQIPVGIQIRDIAIGATRLYVNDSAGRLHTLDRESLKSLGVTQAANGPRITLDEPAQRLYVARDGRPEIVVVDTQTLTVTAVITGGDQLAVDAEHGRLFIGNRPDNYHSPLSGEVRILDRQSLKPVGAIPRPGAPAYNPRRDEIYITDISTYIYDGRSYEPLGELIPEIGAQPLRGCNGCLSVNEVVIYPELDLLIADMTVFSVGAGPGMTPPPRFFSLSSRAPLEWPVAAWRSGSGRLTAQKPKDGLLYSTASYTRYVYYQNLVARRADSSEIVRWRDGLNAALVIPASRVIYTSRAGEMLLALDMDSWLPLGRLPYYDVQMLDLDIHRLYAVEDARLTVLRDSGGQPLPAERAQPVSALPSLEGIYPSPDYDRDHTLFASGGGQLFRSSDGGAHWESLAGGLPRLRIQPLSFHLAISPTFAQDHTLYAGVESGNAIGEGVWRSSDGGASWEPLWQGLEQLRINELAFSPQWASDGTLLAYARYQGLLTAQSGDVLFRSTDRGAHWSVAASRTNEYNAPALPRPADLWPGSGALVQLARREGVGTVSRSRDDGRTWELVLVLPEQSYIASMVAAPNDAQVWYLTTAAALYRTRDAGDHWELADDPRLGEHGVWPLAWQQLALAPAQAGGQWLFLGDGVGNLLTLRSDELAWKPFRAPLPTVTPVAPPPPPPTASVATLAPTLVAPRPITATPTPCLAPFGAAFERYADEARAAVGCPWAEQKHGALAIQYFEHGQMFWREEGGHIYVLFEDGSWQSYLDSWREGQPISDQTLVAPPGREQPVRGFGKLWREQLGGANAAIGWALQGEIGFGGVWQTCELGLLLTDEKGDIYTLRSDGRWTKVTRP
jgi:DNA-binding beta-propeller fold protein YncE